MDPNLIFILGFVVVFFFFFIRPQQKRAKEQENFAKGLEKGQDVVTTSGILGRISKIEDDIVTLQIGDKTFIPFMRSAISKEMTDSVVKQQQQDSKA